MELWIAENCVKLQRCFLWAMDNTDLSSVLPDAPIQATVPDAAPSGNPPLAATPVAGLSENDRLMAFLEGNDPGAFELVDERGELIDLLPAPQIALDDVPADEAPTAAVMEQQEQSDAENWRLKAANDLDKEAFRVHKAFAGKKTMAEVVAMLNDSAAPVPGTEPDAQVETPADGTPTITPAMRELQEQADAVAAEYDEARANFDTENEKSLFKTLRELDRKLAVLSVTEASANAVAQAQNQAEAHAKVLAVHNDAVARAARDYPDSAINGSGFWNDMAAVDAALKAQGNPLYNAPDKAYRIAMMVGNQRGTAPKAGPAAVAPVIPAPKPGVKPRPLTGGISTNGQASRSPDAATLAAAFPTIDALEAYLAQNP